MEKKNDNQIIRIPVFASRHREGRSVPVLILLLQICSNGLVHLLLLDAQ